MKVFAPGLTLKTRLKADVQLVVTLPLPRLFFYLKFSVFPSFSVFAVAALFILFFYSNLPVYFYGSKDCFKEPDYKMKLNHLFESQSVLRVTVFFYQFVSGCSWHGRCSSSRK